MLIDARSRNAALSRLRWPLGLTRAGLLAERITRGFWPLWSVIFVLVAGLMLGLQDSLPLWLVWSVGVLGIGLVAWFAVRGSLGFRWPRRDEALSRLDATMPGRPIQAMLDAQAIGTDDAASRHVWAAHQDRMRARAATAKPVSPDLRVSSRDPFGLRYMAVLALLVAVLFGSLWRVASVVEIASGIGPAQAASGPSWEGWVEPPSYTGLPVIYLNDIAEDGFSAPSGSRITLRLYGEAGAFRVAETISNRPVVTDPKADTTDQMAQDFALAQSGTLAIDGDGGRSWEVTMIADAAPEIDITGEAETSAVGAFTMPFAASDDYEVLSGRALITLDIERLDRRHGLARDPEPRDPIEVDLPMPVVRGRDDFEEVLVEDFSQHPWANLPVKVTLLARDAADNEGHSPDHELTLAARHFFDPMAAAVIEQRRDLLWNRENAGRIAQVLRAVSYRPGDIFKNETTYLRLRFILRRLEAAARHGLRDDQQTEIAAALWELALQLEEGTLADALERMRQAQERLSEAMKNGASDAEIARLMEELREATRDYMQQLERQFAQENQGDGTDQPDQGDGDQNRMTMNQDDIQRMMDRIQELMEQGRMAEAQQALEEFQQMMENMRMTQGEGGQGQSPGQQALEGLGETLREQQGLSDQAFRDLQEQFNPNANAGESQGNEGRSGGQGRGQSHEGQGDGRGEAQGEGEGQTPGEGQRPGGRQNGQGQAQDLSQSLADRQSALRRQLDQQQRGLPGAGTPEGDAARDALDRAGRAMDGAEDALRQDDLAEAIDKQAEAMEALRDGMRNLGEALAQQGQRNPGQQGQTPENFAGGRQNDPLGRNLRGAPGVDDNMLQGEDVYRRARDLLDEIRRRSGEQSRPETERNYLERLLDRF
jgi:uncharacterized protein (TIGR02302 family)